jgi:hypothetical protein
LLLLHESKNKIIESRGNAAEGQIKSTVDQRKDPSSILSRERSAVSGHYMDRMSWWCWLVGMELPDVSVSTMLYVGSSQWFQGPLELRLLRLKYNNRVSPAMTSDAGRPCLVRISASCRHASNYKRLRQTSSCPASCSSRKTQTTDNEQTMPLLLSTQPSSVLAHAEG